MAYIGNKKNVDILNRFLQKGVSNHAFLFSGPSGVGKFTLAEKFAASLILKKNALFEDIITTAIKTDLLIVAPVIEEKKGVIKEKDISIEQIRDAQQQLSLYPYRGVYKVLIIDGANRMTIGAQNALLKTLEEPNATSIIILIAHDEGKMLQTIKSRCQNITFGLVNADELQMMDHRITSEHIYLSAGRPGLLQRMLSDNAILAERREIVDKLKILDGSLVEKLSLAEQFSKDNVKAIENLSLWTWILRLEAQKVLGIDDLSAQMRYNQIRSIMNTLEVLQNTNASARLALEDLLLTI